MIMEINMCGPLVLAGMPVDGRGINTCVLVLHPHTVICSLYSMMIYMLRRHDKVLYNMLPNYPFARHRSGVTALDSLAVKKCIGPHPHLQIL